MTDLLSDVETPSDAELISRVRGGDVAAYGDLFARHKDAAQRLARQLVRGPDSDDLVSEAFAKVLSVLQGGGGPDVAFRAYLLTAVRRLHVDRIRSGQRLQTTDDLTPFDPGVPFQDTAVAGFESGAAAKAFASLPERWQLVLWHLEVEGQKPADIAPLLGMSANSVSALAYRAREGLRQAFLTMHIADLTDTDCRWVNEHLGAFIRKGLSKRDSAKVQAHLDECRRCTAMYLELTEVNSNLAGIIAPLLLGAAATGYLASSGAGAAGLLGVVGRVRDFVAANSGAVTAAGVAAGVATAAAVAAVALGGGGGNAPKNNDLADAPTAVTTPAAPSTSSPTTGPTRKKPGVPAAGESTGVPGTAPTSTLTAAPSATDGALVPGGDLGTGTDDSGAPTDGSTDQPTGGQTGQPAGTTPADVDLSGTTLDDAGVHLVALGDPALPGVMTVRLTSQPAGVRFDPAGDCAVSEGGLAATCTTTSGGSGGQVPGAAAAAAGPASYSAELPFLIPEDQGDTDLDITVDVPDGYRVTGGSGSVKPYTSRTADVRLTAGSSTVPFRDGGYAVTTQLAGVPGGYTGPVRFSLPAGDAALTGSSTKGCALDDGTVLCQDAPSAVTLLLSSDPTKATDVQLRVSALTGYRDPAGANNTVAVTLLQQDADLALTLGTPSRKGTVYTVPAHVSGLPQGYTGKVRYTLVTGEVVTFSSTGCDPIPPTLTCDVPANGDVTFEMTTKDAASDRHVEVRVEPLEGYTDLAPDNNQQGATLTKAEDVPPVTDADLAFTSLTPATVRPGAGDTYDVTGAVSLTGPAAGAVPTLTYTVTGAQFLEDGLTTSTTTRPATTTAPTFTLTHQGASTAVVTVSLPAGFHDTSEGNDSRSATLSPYDVSLSGLTPSTATANQNGDQQLTATLDRDGFEGSIAFSLVGGPSDVTLTGSSLDGSTVTFTLHSAAKDKPAAGVTLRADLPEQFTDYDTSDNEASSSYTYASTPVVQPFAFDGSPVATATSSNDYDVTLKLKDLPAGTSQVVISVPMSQERVNSAVGPCTVAGERTVTCPVGSGATTLTVQFNAQLPGKSAGADRNPVEATAGSTSIKTQITFP